MSVCAPLAIAGHPLRCGSLGSPKVSLNHCRTRGWKRASMEVLPLTSRVIEWSFPERLENAAQLLRAPLENPSREWPLPELVQLYLLRPREVVHEDRVHLRADSPVERDQQRFVVEGERPVVEVHRPNVGPDPVHYHRLGVHHRRLVFIYLHAVFEKLLVVRPPRIPGRLDIGLVAHCENTDIYSPPRSGEEQIHEVVARHEIGVADVESSA